MTEAAQYWGEILKAVVYTEYGSPDVLKFTDVEKPTPTDDEVLIKVHATSLNASDWEYLRGTPLYARFNGLSKPSRHILGSDVAGRIEAVGSNITQFQVGDDVFGDVMYHGLGGFAEYVCAPEKVLARKPASMTFADVSTLPQAAVIAWQGICSKGNVQAGQKVLINGAGGSTGPFAIQLAKLRGADVTGVDTAAKFDLMRSLGADHVIDYTQEDFTRNGQGYDFILDVVAHRSFTDYKRALNPGGTYYMVGGSMKTLLQVVFLGQWRQVGEGKRVRLLAVEPNTQDLATILELIEDGKLKLVIDKQFPLSEAAEALRYLGEGRSKGKVVITVA
jgi:NADPH:quinone reductase-like Zn-dependent oxidoreductase